MSYCGSNPPYYISAYGIAVKMGFEGTVEEWLDSLTAFYMVKKAGYTGTSDEWVKKLIDPLPEIAIGQVVTLDGGSMATVEITGTKEKPVLNFGIPRGMGMVDAMPLVGGTMKGNINMDGHVISNLGNPTEEGHAVNKMYADDLFVKSGQELNKKLSLTGGTMTGALNMNSKQITGLPAPTANSHAVNKSYADAIKETAEEAKETAGNAIPASQKSVANGVPALNADSKVLAKQTRSTIRVINGTSYDVTPEDDGLMLRVYNSNNDCVINLPSAGDDDLENGTEIEILSHTSGKVTIKAPGDRYLLYPDCATSNYGGSLVIGHKYGCVALKKVANVTWIASGDIE